MDRAPVVGGHVELPPSSEQPGSLPATIPAPTPPPREEGREEGAGKGGAGVFLGRGGGKGMGGGGLRRLYRRDSVPVARSVRVACRGAVSQ